MLTKIVRVTLDMKMRFGNWRSIQQMAVICYVKAAHMVRAIMSNALHMNRFVDLCKKIVNMI